MRDAISKKKNSTSLICVALMIFFLFTFLMTGCDVMFNNVSDEKTEPTSNVEGTPKVAPTVNPSGEHDLDWSTVSGTKAKVILISGQSNATGQTMLSFLAQNSEKSDWKRYKAGFENVLINFRVDDNTNSSNNEFVPVATGMGATTSKFGPEIGIADVLSKAYPDETFYIIKCAWSGAGIFANFQPSCNEWTTTTSRIDSAFKALTDQGLTPDLLAICWMQGETDAMNKGTADEYYNLEKDLMERLLARYSKYTNGHTKIIDAGISQYWAFNEIVNAKKQLLANDNDNWFYIDTQAAGLTYLLENGDPAHYDSLSELKLGQLMGETFLAAFNA